MQLKQGCLDFTFLLRPLSQLYHKLLSISLITRIQPKPTIGTPLKGQDPCVYHMDGLNTDNSWAVKHKVQGLIDSDALVIDSPIQNISQNNSPSHNPVGASA